MTDDEFAYLPPEIAEHFRRQQDRTKVHHQVTAHTLQNFVEGLPTDSDLEALDIMLIAAANNPVIANYLRGQIAQIRRSKFGLCGCGEKHEGELATMMQPVSTETTLFNEPRSMDFIMERDFLDDYDEKCAEYGVHQDGTEARPDQVVCDNCGMEFASLRDRMLREPKLAGCHGCQIKSGHG